MKNILICILISIFAIGLCLTYYFLKPSSPQEPIQENDTTSSKISYEEKLFDTSFVHKVEVEIASSDLNDLNQNPIDKTKYHANITIDGVKIENVSFATKGNTTLVKPKQQNSTRFSYKINFGKFQKGQTYFGLDKLHLNNCAWDASFMRDYFSYEILKQTGALTPLVSFTELYLNGEYRGLYLAIEDIDRSFLARNQKDTRGSLYKPETSMMANVGKQNKNLHSNEPLGVDLVYRGDTFENYASIFDHAVHEVTDQDKTFLIQAIKALNEKTDAKKYWDIDAIISYFAGTDFALCVDSYLSSVPHNYYLLAENQKLSILPWDFDLSFGASIRIRNPYHETDFSKLSSYPIDEPLYHAEVKDRPLWSLIVNNPEYLEQYHHKLIDLMEGYFQSSAFEQEFERVYEMIQEHVKTDPTKLYSDAEFEWEARALKDFCLERARFVTEQISQ